MQQLYSYQVPIKSPSYHPQFITGRGGGQEEAPRPGRGRRGGERMFVLTTEYELTKETKRILREQFKKETGEDCIVLDLGMKVTQISVKKDSATGGNR